MANAVFLGRVVAAYTTALTGGPEAMVRAAEILPYTADSYWYDLSVQTGHLLVTQGRTEEGLRHYRESLKRDPYNNPLWLLVAAAEQIRQHPKEAQHAYLMAFHYEPNRPESHWMYANFLLRGGRELESHSAFRELLTRSRRFDEPVFQTIAGTASYAALEDRVLPPSGVADMSYLRFVLQNREPAAALRAWARLKGRLRDVSAAEMAGYCRLLIEAASWDKSWEGWREWRSARETAKTPEDLLRNGGFEQEPDGGPYDWTFHSNPSLHAYRDTTVSRSPASSARVVFLGTGNYAGPLVEQWLFLDPGGTYQVSFAWRARRITTDQAPRLELWEAGGSPRVLGAIVTEPGTSPWRRQALLFKVGQCPLVRLVLARLTSQKLDNAISGDFWIDDVAVEPATP